jgi:hypothetical protein
MAGFTVGTNANVIRDQLHTTELKRTFDETVMGTKYVRLITDQFPDGNTLNIPSLGQFEVHDYEEDRSIVYSAADTGNFQFSITDYVSSGTYISEKFKQDSMWAPQIEAAFVPGQHYALAVRMETDILKTPNAGQTASDTNQINSVDHRWVGTGTNEQITLNDFAKADYALDEANVPAEGRVAIVHPSVAYTLGTQTNLMNLMSPQPAWQGIVNQGYVTGMRFVTNIFGFDVYVSRFLPQVGAETIGSKTTAQGVTNLFFAATNTNDAMPIIGQIRQQPKVETEYKKDLQRTEYVTTCRYGFKLYRPENMVIILTDTDQVN